MTSQNRCVTNRKIMPEIGEIIHTLDGEFTSNDLAKILNARKKSRGFTSGRVGCLLRYRDDVVKVSPCIWRRVEA